MEETNAWPNAKHRVRRINEQLKDSYYEKRPDRIDAPYMSTHTVVGDSTDVRKLVVHSFKVKDVDDPDLWAAEFLYDWEKSDAGQWVMQNAVNPPTWHRSADPISYGYKYVIVADFTGPPLTEWLLKYGK